MKLFKNLFSALNKDSIKYMVAGGIAVNLYGIERATADIDIVVKLEEKNLYKFVNAVKRLGLKPKVPVALEEFISAEKRKTWMQEKGMLVFSLFDPKNPFFLLDIFIEVPFDFDSVYKNRKKMKLENTVVPVVPIETLVAMKEESGRPQDKADTFYLKKVLEEWDA